MEPENNRLPRQPLSRWRRFRQTLQNIIRRTSSPTEEPLNYRIRHFRFTIESLQNWPRLSQIYDRYPDIVNQTERLVASNDEYVFITREERVFFYGHDERLREFTSLNGQSIREIHNGQNHWTILTENGQLWSWGENLLGQVSPNHMREFYREFVERMIEYFEDPSNEFLEFHGARDLFRELNTENPLDQCLSRNAFPMAYYNLVVGILPRLDQLQRHHEALWPRRHVNEPILVWSNVRMVRCGREITAMIDQYGLVCFGWNGLVLNTTHHRITINSVRDMQCRDNLVIILNYLGKLYYVQTNPFDSNNLRRLYFHVDHMRYVRSFYLLNQNWILLISSNRRVCLINYVTNMTSGTSATFTHVRQVMSVQGNYGASQVVILARDTPRNFYLLRIGELARVEHYLIEDEVSRALWHTAVSGHSSTLGYFARLAPEATSMRQFYYSSIDANPNNGPRRTFVLAVANSTPLQPAQRASVINFYVNHLEQRLACRAYPTLRLANFISENLLEFRFVPYEIMFMLMLHIYRDQDFEEESFRRMMRTNRGYYMLSQVAVWQLAQYLELDQVVDQVGQLISSEVLHCIRYTPNQFGVLMEHVTYLFNRYNFLDRARRFGFEVWPDIRYYNLLTHQSRSFNPASLQAISIGAVVNLFYQRRRRINIRISANHFLHHFFLSTTWQFYSS